MFLYPIINFLGIILAIFLGVLVYSRDTTNKLNRLFLLGTFVAIFSARLEFLSLTASDAEHALLYFKFSFLWPFYPLIFLEFALTFSGRKLSRKVKYILFTASLIIALLFCFTELLYQNKMVHYWYGWECLKSENIITVLSDIYAAIAYLVSFTIMIMHYLTLKGNSEKKQLLFAMAGLGIPLVTDAVSEEIVRPLGYSFPPIDIPFFFVGMIVFAFALLKYGFLRFDPLETVKKVFSNISDNLVIMNQKGTIVLVSDSFLHNTHFDSEEVMGKQAGKFFFNENTPVNEFSKLIGKETELLLDDKTGVKIPVSVTVSKMDGKYNADILYVVFARDLRERKLFELTEKKYAEERLNKSEGRYRSLIENINEVYFATDKFGRTTYISSNVLMFSGYEPEFFIGKWSHMLVSKGDFRRVFQFYKEMIDKGLVDASIEFRAVKKDGTEYWVEQITRIIRNVQGEIVEFRNVARDISERKANEERLNNYRNHLENLVEERTKELGIALQKEKEWSELKSGFISSASHEFRTPLTSILTSADLLEMYGFNLPPEKFRKYINIIQTSVEYMTSLTNDVLTISKSETNKVIFSPAITDLKQLIMGIIDNAKLSSPGNINLLYEYNPEKLLFNIDSKLLTQIISNLISNAVKYSPDGGNIKLAVSHVDSYLHISVADEGIGIPEENIPHLFEPFYRAHNASHLPGTGLGLSIVSKTAELHNGRIEVESKLNEGTMFTVIIKLDP